MHAASTSSWSILDVLVEDLTCSRDKELRPAFWDALNAAGASCNGRVARRRRLRGPRHFTSGSTQQSLLPTFLKSSPTWQVWGTSLVGTTDCRRAAAPS